MKKIKYIWILLLLVWAFLAVIGHTKAEEIKDSQLYAQAAVLMDADSGRVLYGKNADQILAMASTTKIMTCIIALEYADITEEVMVSSYAAGMPAVKLGVKRGEKYCLEDLLYSLMLESHNDVAVVIAENIGKKFLKEEQYSKPVSDYTVDESKKAVAEFVRLMNNKAGELGCDKTWFITPNGLDGEETVFTDSGEKVEKIHSTTAEELARIMAYCILDSPKTADFLKITQTPTYVFSSENGRTFSCYNHNSFLNMMSGAVSGKTGFTNRAGYCYVGALERDGRSFVVALLACGWPSNKNYKWIDTRKLMEYGIENYYYRSFLDEKTVFDKDWLDPIPITDGQTKILGEQAYVELEVVKTPENVQNGLLMKTGEQITVEYSQKESLQAPVEKGMPVGEVRYIVDGITYRTEEIITSYGVEKVDWQWCLEQIFDRYLRFD